MTEREKKDHGEWYNGRFDHSLRDVLFNAKEKCYELNMLNPLENDKRKEILKSFLGSYDESSTILSPFQCDYGYNIKIGKKCFINHFVYIMDCAPITIGNHVLIGPFSGLYTAIHATHYEDRNAGFERTEPIVISDNVWIGGNVTVLPGVTIGEGSIIGAKSLVNKDIPAGVIAAGNPCKVLRKITEEDRLNEEVLKKYL